MKNNIINCYKFLVCVLIVYSLLGCKKSYDNNNFITKYNLIKQNTIPIQLNDLLKYEIDDLDLELYKLNYEENYKWVYDEDIKAINSGHYKFLLKSDFNNNGKEDLIIVCRDSKYQNSYLIILEKDVNDKVYSYINHFKFSFFKIFIYGDKKDKEIILHYQASTDWIEEIKWDGKKYHLKIRDPYGP